MSAVYDTYEGKDKFKVLKGTPERKCPLKSFWRRWEDNITTDLQEICWGRGLDWSDSKHGQVAGYCAYGNTPSGSIKCGEFFD